MLKKKPFSAEAALRKQKESIAREEKYWQEQKARVESDDLIGYFREQVRYLTRHIAASAHVSEYRFTVLTASEKTLELLSKAKNDN